MSRRLDGENAMVIGDYYPAHEVERSETPFEREINLPYFGPRQCPGWNHADCVTQIDGPQYFCAACSDRAAAFRELLRKERGAR